MQQDVRLRAAARVIYDACYRKTADGAASFEEAERHGTAWYRHAVEAAQGARSALGDPAVQLSLM